MTTIRDAVRAKIAGFKGAQFSSADLPNHSNICTVLKRLEAGGEIKVVGYESTKGKPRRLYQEQKLKEERTNAAKKPVPKASPWSYVWPEFFVPPEFQGSSRIFTRLTNIEED
jgi:hypothetical protein